MIMSGLVLSPSEGLKMATTSFPVRFMGAHPVFGKTKRTKTSDGKIQATATGVPYLKSPYYWWWYALRLSDAYRVVCESRGKTADKNLAQVYADFGNVFDGSFEAWWKTNGARLFGEPSGPKRVSVVTADELDAYSEAVASGQTLMLAIPMFLTKREIATAVKKVVSKNHKGARGKSAISTRQQESQALYKLHHFKGIESVARALDVLEGRKAGTKLKDLRKTKLEEIAAVSRFEKKGKIIIQGVERGEFPLLKG